MSHSLALDADTIAAIATAQGKAGIGVVRVSGSSAAQIARRVLGFLPKPRHATQAVFLDAQGEPMDAGLALYFPEPHSYTGESVLELQGHGGDTVLAVVLENVLLAGARLARAGEFSERAFLNNKIDLTQVEAVADLIDSSSKAAAKAAMQSLSGRFSTYINRLCASIWSVRTLLEAHLDFPDEDIDALPPADLADTIQAIKIELDRLIDSAQQGRLLRDGIRAVLVGPPNVGKSSLMNYLTEQDTSIVTQSPGTTRDVVRATVVLDGLALHLADTAGLRERSQDEAERIGIERARGALDAADLVLSMTEIAVPGTPARTGVACDTEASTHWLHIENKIDLHDGMAAGATADGGCRISVRTGAGLDVLKQQIAAKVGFRGEQQGEFIARLRHVEALRAARAAIERGIASSQRTAPLELIAEDLRCAHERLGQITGRVTTEEMLGRIFSSFCIGK